MAQEGQKSTLMAAYFHTVDVDGATVGDAAETNENLPLIAVIGKENKMVTLSRPLLQVLP
jgi:hypothetical protein